MSYKTPSIMAGMWLALLSSALCHGDLLSDGTISAVDSQLNSSSWSADNLTDGNQDTRWLSTKQANDINFDVSPAGVSGCFESLELVNYGDSGRSVREFMLFSTEDESLATDVGVIGWTPVVAQQEPIGLMNHLSWAQGGRITSIAAQLNTSNWGAKNLNDHDSSSRWLSGQGNNIIEFAFDSDWDGDATDVINISQIAVTNYGNSSRSVKEFQIEVTSDGVNWNKLELPGSNAGDDDYIYTRSWSGGILGDVDGQLNSSSWGAKNIHDGDPNSRWLSGKSNNTLEFTFDPDDDNQSGLEGDSTDLFTLEKLYLRNYGASGRSVREFQVEVKTQGNGSWAKLKVPGSAAGDDNFNFLLSHHGGSLVGIDSQLNTSSWAAKNINDGDANSRWLSAKSNNTLDFRFDVDDDGTTGGIGDRFTAEKIIIQNYGSDDRSVKTFQVEVKTFANNQWTKLKVPGAVVGEDDFNFLLNHQGGILVNIDSQLNTSSWAAKNINDGDKNSRWLSSKSNNILDFRFDVDGDGIDGELGDRFTAEKIFIQNYGADDRAIKDFQVEVKVFGSSQWMKIPVPGSTINQPGYNFVLAAQGGNLSAVDGELNTGSWAAANIHDGDVNSRWLSNKQNNTLVFTFDSDLDGGINLDTIELTNYGVSGRSIQTFEIDIQIANGTWQSLLAPGGGSTFTASMDAIGQSWGVSPQTDVTAMRMRTLSNHGDPSYTGAREIVFSGNSLTRSYTFVAAMNGGGETFVLDPLDQPENVTDIRFRTISNHGDPSYTGAREIQILGKSISKSSTFIAEMHGSEQEFVLDQEDRPVDVTGMRFISISNHGDPSYTGVREIKILGKSIGESSTFVAQMHGDGQEFLLDPEDWPIEVAALRFVSISNHGDPSYTGAAEFEAIGSSLTPSHTFTLPMSVGPHVFVLDADDKANAVIAARFVTIQNHGDPSYTGMTELALLGEPVGPSYIFSAENNRNLQSYAFAKTNAEVFRFHSLGNYGDSSYTGMAELVVPSASCAPTAVAHWSMNEATWGTVIDEIGDHNGTAFNGANTTGGSCRYGQFDGVDDYVEVPHNDALNGRNSLTYMAMIRADSWSDTSQIIAKSVHGGGTGPAQMGIFAEGGVLKGRAETGSGRVEITAALPPVSGDWVHLTLVFDQSSLTLYIDGVMTATSSFTNRALVESSDPINIGKQVGSDQYYFDGLIDDVRVYAEALTPEEINAVIATITPCDVGGVDHFDIDHNTNAIYCAATPVTVTAEDNTGSAFTLYTGTITLDTGSALGDWIVSDGSGTLNNGTANDGIATYNFGVDDQGQAVFTLDHSDTDTTSSLSLNISVVDGAAFDDDLEGLLHYSSSGFTITGSALNVGTNPLNIDLPIPSQIAGSDFDIYIAAFGQTATDAHCGVIESYNGSYDLNFSVSYDDPVSGSLTPTVNGESISSSRAVAFTKGQAQVSVKYKDAGSISLAARDNDIEGASNQFVVVPAKFAIQLTGNPGAIDENAGVFNSAGTVFPITVLAQDISGDVTPNYGNEISPESIDLSHTLALPSGGREGDLNGALVKTVGGTFFGNYTFDEVGIIVLEAEVAVDADYLGAGNVSNIVRVGRFIPASFAVLTTSDSVRPANTDTANFTYMGQPFFVNYTVQAQTSLSPSTVTENYSGGFAKLDLNHFSDALSDVDGTTAAVAYSAIDLETPAALSTRLRAAGQTPLWVSGKAAVIDLPLIIDRAGILEGPASNIDIGVLLMDSDAVTLAGLDLDSSNSGDNDTFKVGTLPGELLYGRIFVPPNYGPEIGSGDTTILPFEVQSYNGTTFVKNEADSATEYGQGSVMSAASVGNFTGNLNMSNFDVSDVNFPIIGAVVSEGTADGISVNRPGQGNEGSVDVTLTVDTWLQYNWSGAGISNPTTTINFGSYRGHDKIIYWREQQSP